MEPTPLGVGTSEAVGPGGRWVAAAVAAVLRAEHEGTPVASVGAPPPGIVPAIRGHRVTSLLTDHAVALGLGEGATRRLTEVRLNDVTQGLGVVVHTRIMSAALTDAGVDHLVVKGIALSDTVGRGAATRGPGDIDTWVRPADLGVAMAALADAGWHRRPTTAGLPEVGSGWRWGLVERVGQELALDHPQHATVDLHWRLSHDGRELPFGFEEAWAASVPLEGVGPGVRGLCPRHALAHVAHHARKEHFCILRQCVDVVDLARICGPGDTAALAAHDPNVALALAVSAPLAPWVRGSVPSRRVARLAGEVQRDLGSLRWTHAALHAAQGTSRFSTRWAREWWLVRSAPRPAVAVRHVGRSLVPLRLLTDTAPLRHRRDGGTR